MTIVSGCVVAFRFSEKALILHGGGKAIEVEFKASIRPYMPLNGFVDEVNMTYVKLAFENAPDSLFGGVAVAEGGRHRELIGASPKLIERLAHRIHDGGGFGVAEVA